MQCLFGTSFLQAAQAVKIKFKIDKESSSKIKLKNQFCEIQILKNQVQINKMREGMIHKMEKDFSLSLLLKKTVACLIYTFSLSFYSSFGYQTGKFTSNV